jgi:hypothetical protein
MVERVRINSSQIILKDSDNRVSFDTANFYLKTDPNGQLKAGGYAESPSIWGYNDGIGRDISNKAVGWYTTNIITGGIWNNTAINITVPSSTSAKIVIDSRFNYYIAGAWKLPAQPALFNGVDSGTTFRWIIIYSDSGVWYAGIEHNPIATSVSGAWTYPATALTASQIASISVNRYVGPDAEGNPGYYGDFTLANFSWPGFASTYLIPTCIMTLRNPVTLSVAPTL